MTENKKKMHGGLRAGSGRKKMDRGEKKQKITFSLSSDVIKFLSEHRPSSQTVEKMVREYANRLEQETKNRPS